MKLSLEAIQILDAIERRGSFAAAATELHRVPSALTYQVQKLEQDLDVLLFDRRGHRAQLTPAGRELLAEGRLLLRAADELEYRVKRLALGWEPELRIALDTMIGAERLMTLIERFYTEHAGTRIRIASEVLGGTWDALADGRADLIIGASGDAPPGGGYSFKPLGETIFVFAVAPTHPLAAAPEPLSPGTILEHRAVAVGDTSRHLAPRSTGLLTGQDVLTVPDISSKLAAQIAGLGCGFLPIPLASKHIEAGALVVKEVEEEKPRGRMHYAWRTKERGKALRWFLKQLEDARVQAELLDH
ncbi:MAG TPA: LysR family transcriptional regulator [Burkholderiales bacterium]|nr:LysR family transcriptional regulator [Burkholderiales bacterium]